MRAREVVRYCGFDSHFPDDWDAEHLFVCFLEMYILLWKNVYSDLSLIFKLGFLSLSCKNFFFTRSGYNYLLRCIICNYFLPFCGFFSHFLDGVLLSTHGFCFVLISTEVFYFCFWFPT